MVCAKTIEFIRAPGGDVPLRVYRSLDDERAGVGGRGRFHPLGELNLELVPRPGAGRGGRQKKVHR